ncbi:MAG: LysM peptidoglycan-binding domain-containing protein [Clostridia bacterium]|jgi:LysM domain protein|nr:LysM peptidoglycan-binding domain-containing protein [Clostridium sp.]HJJ12842.1 LysM peptidoglycan-binding domain-containing protein [Clostridiaceae bacterium]
MKSKRGIIIIIFIVITVFAKTSYSKQEVNYKVTSIGFGETLWSIAKKEQETNKYYEGKDIRFVINDIKYNNNLKDSNLYEGMELKIPSM